MSSPPNDSGLRDNHTRGSVGRFLQDSIRPGSELSFVSAYFTVHAYAALKDSLESADHLRFLFGEPSSVTSLEKERKEGRRFILGNERQELTLGNQLTQKQVARDCAAWIRDKVAIRSVTRSGFLHGKLYHKGGAQPAPLPRRREVQCLCQALHPIRLRHRQWRGHEPLRRPHCQRPPRHRGHFYEACCRQPPLRSRRAPATIAESVTADQGDWELVTWLAIVKPS